MSRYLKQTWRMRPKGGDEMGIAYEDLSVEDIEKSFWKSAEGQAATSYYIEEELGGARFDEQKFKQLQIFQEHDQWWLRHDTGEREMTYSVVECATELGVEYLGYEVVSENIY
jgi:hypothetical protein